MKRLSICITLSIFSIIITGTLIFAAAGELSPRVRYRILSAWFTSGNEFMTGENARLEVLGKPHGIYYCGFKGLILYGDVVNTVAKITGTKTGDFYSLAPLERLSGFKIFTNGDSLWDTWGSKKPRETNRFNPAFLAWAFHHLVPAPQERIGRRSCLEIYQRIFRRFGRLLVDSYLYLDKKNLFHKEQQAYERAMKKPRFEALSFLEERFGRALPRYRKYRGIASPFTPEMAMGFWIRRSIDGTRQLLWEGISDFMNHYDSHWFNQRKARQLP